MTQRLHGGGRKLFPFVADLSVASHAQLPPRCLYDCPFAYTPCMLALSHDSLNEWLLIRERGARALEERLGARQSMPLSAGAHTDIEAPAAPDKQAEQADTAA